MRFKIILMLCFLLCGCATNESLKALNFRDFDWKPARNLAEAEEMCFRLMGKKIPACLKYVDGVCVIVSIDTKKNFSALGKEVENCFNLTPPIYSLTLGLTKQVTYKFIDHRSLQFLCNNNDDQILEARFIAPWDNHMGGCTGSFKNRSYILITQLPRYPDLSVHYFLGHEFKHVYKPSWHATNGVETANAFIGTD